MGESKRAIAAAPEHYSITRLEVSRQKGALPSRPHAKGKIREKKNNGGGEKRYIEGNFEVEFQGKGLALPLGKLFKFDGGGVSLIGQIEEGQERPCHRFAGGGVEPKREKVHLYLYSKRGGSMGERRGGVITPEVVAEGTMGEKGKVG